MILGIGTDLANIDRIARTLDRFGDRFRNRVYTDLEQHKAENRADVAGTYANQGPMAREKRRWPQLMKRVGSDAGKRALEDFAALDLELIEALGVPL